MRLEDPELLRDAAFVAGRWQVRRPAAAYCYTRDLGRAFRVSRRLEAGSAGMNEGTISTKVAPFGGVKQSGLGREGGRQGIEEYLEVQYTLLGGLDG